MKLQSMQCNNCGATLEVPESTRFLTCNYCNSKLSVHREGSASYTEVLEKIEQRTEKIDENLEIIKLQHELERLDREWESGKRQYMVKDDKDYKMPDEIIGKPNKIVSVIAGVVFLAIFSIVALTIFGGMRSMNAPFLVTLVPLGMIVFVILAVVSSAFSTSNRLGKFQSAKTQYDVEREQVLRKIRNLDS
ncbi:hypothetical protein JXA32_09315 [Candidatus Sumerlaeota bacterium]|nr:hypothetical protein [Candidatus Sumerlaeota bacterium]